MQDQIQILELINRKKTGGELRAPELHWLVEAALSGQVPDYQLSALLMAICLKGLNYRETAELTRAFIDSGEQLTWDGMGRPVVDKHSTGGVGDKVSLLLVPWLAAAGCIVPKMSGRGLGHTGGTIDKLESIPGFSVDLSPEQLSAQLQDCGCAIVAQSASLVPADKLFYALRDATGTVDEMGLIAASIMSKKLAGGAEYIVLDVKHGSGAFFAEEADAAAFGRLAMSIGKVFRRGVSVVLSLMDQPLGRAVGNALEVEEVLDAAASRKAEGPVVESCLPLAVSLLTFCGLAADETTAQKMLNGLLENGTVEAKLHQWIAAQGGRLAEFRNLLAREKASRGHVVEADTPGIVSRIDALQIGKLARSLGAGRLSKEDIIDPFAGVELAVEAGSEVRQGDAIATLYPGENSSLELAEAANLLRAAVELGG